MVTARGLIFLTLMWPGSAAAHDVEQAPAAAAALAWSFEPWVIASLAWSAAFYALGLVRLWQHAGRGRGVHGGRAACFALGWLTLLVALVTPLDALGGHLFSAHMLQHESLMVLAAPLLVLGRPLAVWAWALAPGWRRRLGRAFHHPLWRRPWRAITAPLSAWSLHAIVLWGWHVPVLFEAALASNAVHGWQHVSFLFGALLFWWSALGPSSRTALGFALLSLFTTMLHTGALGALLTLSPQVWYPSYLSRTGTFGIDALSDQQLGGLLMWLPAGMVYLVTGLALVARGLGPGSSLSGTTSQWRTR